MPTDLLSECLHPQEEEPDIGTAMVAPPVVAAEPGLVEATSVEPMAVRAEGVRGYTERLQRHALARALKVREDESEEQGDRAETVAVGYRQVVGLAELGAELFHLRDRFAQRLFGEARNPEHDRLLGRFVVLEIPVLEIIEVLTGRAGLGRMGLQGEALFDLPRHRPSIGHGGG